MFKHPRKGSPSWFDVLVVGGVTGLIYACVMLAARWRGQGPLATEISLSPYALPKYSMFSLSRAVIAYGISFVFSLTYGYAAAKSKRAERVLIPALDILQAVPVLGFLPGLVLGLQALFPRSNVGLELACVLMIFTSQAWNMTYSFYSSVKAVPKEMTEACRVMGLSWFGRFKRLELPFSSIGLAWNSMMSMAGSWFFLTVCESFPLGDKKFQIPGIGSYMAVAIDQGDKRAMVFGVIAMFAIILFVDFVVCRPLIVWVQKFQMDEIQDEVADLPFVTVLLRESWIIRRLKLFFARRRHAAALESGAAPKSPPAKLSVAWEARLVGIRGHLNFSKKIGVKILAQLATPCFAVLCVWGGFHLWEFVRTLPLSDWRVIWSSTLLTAARVTFAVVVGSLWTIPFGVIIGSSPRLLRIFQPIVQICASFPAPMLYPLALAIMYRCHVSLHWGAAVLMMLGVQWYVLFNVIAGGMNITRDLRDNFKLLGISRKSFWMKLYLPAVFPTLVIGWFTAAGGAWNASIVAEYIQYNGELRTVPGIGSMISRAAVSGNFSLLAASLLALVVTVIALNQTLWRWLHELADTRFRFER